MSCVGLVHYDHTAVAPQFPRELPLAHINCMDLGYASLQQAIREAPGRSANVQGGDAFDFELEALESVFELVTAPADVFFRSNQPELIAGFDRVAGFGGEVVVDPDLAGHDGAFGFFAAFAQAAIHQFLIQATHDGQGRGARWENHSPSVRDRLIPILAMERSGKLSYFSLSSPA